MFCPQKSPSPSLTLHWSCKYFAPKILIFPSVMEKNSNSFTWSQFQGTAFMADPQSSWWNTQMQVSGRAKLSRPPQGFQKASPSPNPSPAAGRAGEDAGASNAERAGSCPAACSKSTEQPIPLPGGLGGAFGHGGQAERRRWESLEPVQRSLEVSNSGGRGRGHNGLVCLSLSLLNSLPHPLPSPTGHFLYSSPL